MLYVNTYKGDTWAVNAKTGKVHLRRRENTDEAVLAGDQRRAPDREAKGGTVSALSRRNGSSSGSCGRTQVESSPAMVNGIVYFGATDGRLFAVDADTGKIRWVYNTGGRINRAPRSPTGGCA